jgi:hypothetical protein
MLGIQILTVNTLKEILNQVEVLLNDKSFICHFIRQFDRENG